MNCNYKQTTHVVLHCCRYSDNISAVSVDNERHCVATRRQEETTKNKDVKEIQVCMLMLKCGLLRQGEFKLATEVY